MNVPAINVMKHSEREALKKEAYELLTSSDVIKKAAGGYKLLLAWWHRYISHNGYISLDQYSKWILTADGRSY